MQPSIEELATQVRTALETGDLDAYQHLLAADVHWGPVDDPQWGCHNRREVLAWYKAARKKGVGSTVNEVVIGTDCLLVGLTVSGVPAADDLGGTAPRWQVLTVKYGRLLELLQVRVCTDVFTGTSAGGINAACLGLGRRSAGPWTTCATPLAPPSR